VVGGRSNTDGRTTDLSAAVDAQRRAEHIGSIDEDEG